MAGEFDDVGPIDVIYMETLKFSRYMKYLDLALGLEDKPEAERICDEITWEVKKSRHSFERPEIFKVIRDAVDIKSNYANIRHAFKWRNITITPQLGFKLNQNVWEAVTRGDSLHFDAKLDAIAIYFNIPFSMK